MTRNEIIGKNIRKLRIMNGYNRMALATFLNVTQRHMLRIENGEETIAHEDLDKLAMLFNVQVSDITREKSDDHKNEIDDMYALCAVSQIQLNLGIDN